MNTTQQNEQKLSPLERALKICGSQKKLADLCKVRQQQISKWMRNGVPHARVLLVERATKGLVTRYELRPDFYPRD